MASEMVMAYGDHGLESTPVEEAVEIRALPVGAGNIVIPATLRFFRKSGGRVPTRLIRVEKPSARNGRKHVLVRFACAPFERYQTPEGVPVYGHEDACQVRNVNDALDPLFAGLTKRERARISRAVAAMEPQP